MDLEEFKLLKAKQKEFNEKMETLKNLVSSIETLEFQLNMLKQTYKNNEDMFSHKVTLNDGHRMEYCFVTADKDLLYASLEVGLKRNLKQLKESFEKVSCNMNVKWENL